MNNSLWLLLAFVMLGTAIGLDVALDANHTIVWTTVIVGNIVAWTLLLTGVIAV